MRGGPIRPARLLVKGADLLEQLLILPTSCTRHAPLPRVVPAGGDAQHLAHGGEGMGGLIRLHELEPFDGIEPVSRANQAAAFFRISRSSRSAAFLSPETLQLPRSSVVRPSRWRLASRSACRTQFRIHYAEGSNSLASDSGLRPLRTSSMNRSRYSSGYGRCDFGIVSSMIAQNGRESTTPGQLHKREVERPQTQSRKTQR